MMTLALTPGLVRRAAPGRGWLAVAILVAVPSAALLAGWAYVEWIATFGALASYTLIRVSNSEKVDRALILAAFFAALAVNSKYTAIWLVLGLGLVVSLRGRSLRRWAAFMLCTAAFMVPFLLINWLLTENPVYPFVFDGIFWDDHRAFWFSRMGTGLGGQHLGS
jgi:4-amino-4-deoxy-L-arabinose transferase-like glycosyltransferase